jgi:hypothetical protein
MSWDELQLDLSKSKAFAFAILFDQKTKMNRIQDNDVEIKNNERIINEISSQYAEFHDIFSKIDAHKLSKHDSQNHIIKILSSREFFFDSIYNLFAAELKILKTYIDKYMKKKFIRKSMSFANILIFFVKKFDDKLHLCVNYRELNEIIIKNRYLLFLINKILNELFEIKIVSKLNVQNIFYRIHINNNDEWKTMFKCRFDHYQYWVMFFELSNSSTTFQIYLNQVMHFYLNVFVLIYINDILIFRNRRKKTLNMSS